MSIATHAIKYGWVYLATLTLGAGTIFMADPVLRRITLKDRIEVTLAVVERCLATQYSTNPILYRVDPPSIVRTWTDTNGASVIMTNAIEWRDDLSMKVELDAKIEALCPYYVDANSVYDGSTNIVMHTFTGLLASLDLGDHTNFTAIPTIGTNAATFGAWAWRNYVTPWQERYKLLNALSKTRITPVVSSQCRQAWGQFTTNDPYNSWAVVTSNLAATGTTVSVELEASYFLVSGYISGPSLVAAMPAWFSLNSPHWFWYSQTPGSVGTYSRNASISISGLSTDMSATITVLCSAVASNQVGFTNLSWTEIILNEEETSIIDDPRTNSFPATNAFGLSEFSNFGSNNYQFTYAGTTNFDLNFPDVAFTAAEFQQLNDYAIDTDIIHLQGASYAFQGVKWEWNITNQSFAEWDFQYCTNKFW